MTKNVNADVIRQDLKHQLSTPGDLDWDYLIKTAMRGKFEAEKDGVNMAESPRTIEQIIEDAKSLSEE